MEPPREAEVGVLFVHGIGQQTPGDTLISFGEPLMGWVRRWVEGRRSGRWPTSSFEVVKSALSEPLLEPGAPAHLLFQTGRACPDGHVQSRWLLAESCWATEFRNPPFGRLAAWMVGVGAWMILSHFGKLIRLRLAGRKRVLGLPLLLFALLLALATQLLVALLGLAAVIPIPRFRRALSGLLVTLTGTLGDSYVVLSSPVQEAAAVSRLRHDLAWLSDRVDKVFVVAHSQGAAIAHRALQGPRPEKVCRLITFGSGIGKLEELRLLAQPDHRNFYLAAQLGLPLAALWLLLLLPRAVATLRSSYLLWGMDFLSYALVLAPPVAILTWLLKRTWSGWPHYLRHVREKLPLEGLEWHDFYSTADPVPNGSLAGEPGLAGLKDHQVVNLRSAVADHSAYWANQDEFVSSLVQEIDGAAGTRLIAPDEVSKLEKASGVRRKRVRLLLVLRAMSVAGAGIALARLWAELPRLAEQLVWKPLTGWTRTGLIGSAVEAVGSGLARAARLATGVSEETLRIWGLFALGVLILLSGVALGYLVAARGWKWWDRFAVDDFLTLRPKRISTFGAAVVTVLLGAAPLLLAALTTGDVAASLPVLGDAFRWSFLALFILFLSLVGPVIGLLALWLSPAAWKRKLVVAGAALLVGVPALIFAVAAVATRDLERSLDLAWGVQVRIATVALLPVAVVLFISLVWALSVWLVGKLR